ncbi:MAG: fatty acyl-AMP ligase [bacterium]|nr:fatty acyl-AMP ligase [bacterium]
MILHSEPYLDVLARHYPDDPMCSTESMVEVTVKHAQNMPDETAYYFQDQPVTYRRLHNGICSFAAQLHDTGVKKGDRVILLLENSRNFFFAYYGVQRLGAVAVPMFHSSSNERIALLIKLSGARALVTPQPLSNEAEIHIKQLAEIVDVDFSFLNIRQCEERDVENEISHIPFPRSGDLAMLQYTSGTTGHPKGVMLTHGNLIANVRQMIPKALFTPKDVFVSWLPVYHDMGLITMTMCPFYLGALLVLLPISIKPTGWFDAIKRYKGTMTAAPDFVYRFTTKFSRKAPKPGTVAGNSYYDISSLRIALIAAEPVRAKTISDFEAKFNLNGVLKPGYGLAESSVAVSFWDPDTREILTDQQNHVSVGNPLPGIDVAIVSGPHILEPGQVGEIVFRSPSATTGYYRNPKATAELHFKDGFIRTGDLGYIDQKGKLFIVDRIKNVIIRAGRNISPREIEEIIDTVEGVRLSAVFGVEGNSIVGERLHIVVEINHRNGNTHERIVSLPAEIRDKVKHHMGIIADKLHMVKPKTIPRTYNGKIKYPELKSMFFKGTLQERGIHGN